MTAIDVPQHLSALAVANEVRRERFVIWNELAALPIDESRDLAAELVFDPPRALRNVLPGTLIEHCSNTGPEYARRILLSSRVSPMRALGQLTSRERLALGGALQTFGRAGRQAGKRRTS